LSTNKQQKFIVSVIQLSRPVNVFIVVLTVFLAAVISDPHNYWVMSVFWASLVGAFIMAGANTINDYFDVDIDRINKPDRPIPAGNISRQTALNVAGVEFLIGLALNIFLPVEMFVVAVITTLFLILYSARLKRMALWGNFVVSLITILAFIFGGMAVGRPEEAILPGVFSFFFHFGREIIKDIQDAEGDSLHNALTFPVKYGNRAAIRLIHFLFILLILVTYLPYRIQWYSSLYFAIVLVGVYPVIFYVLWRLRKNPTPAQLGFLSNLLKADMLIGLLAVYFR